MITRITSFLFCAALPVMLQAQAVELRSPDEFITVEGEIVNYDGTLLRVRTRVSVISVPASEVICYGQGCLEVIASNGFGLTEEAFIDVVAVSPDDVQALSDTLTVGFNTSAHNDLYRTLASAFAVDGQADLQISLGATGQLTLEDAQNNETLTLGLSEDAALADILLQSIALSGTQPAVYDGPLAWALETRPPYQMVGLQAFSVLVAPTAGIAQIGVDDLARIYVGDLTNWAQLGGADMAILPLQLMAETALQSDIRRLIMDPAGLQLSEDVLTMTDEAGIIAAIRQFPGSIGIVNSIDAPADVRVDIIGSCGLATAPTTFNIISGDYPLIRPIMATYAAEPQTTLATRIFDFAATDTAQEALSSGEFIDYNAVLQDAVENNARVSGLLDADFDDDQRDAAALMFQILFEADRISTSFQGGEVSGPEGAWNRAMLIDLIAVLENPDNAGREVILAGFGNSAAGNAAAINAAAAAAGDMKVALLQMASDVIADGDYTLSSHGFGNIAPATCYNGQVTSAEYTRVEVWIR